jgi:hypothetical protein
MTKKKTLKPVNDGCFTKKPTKKQTKKQSDEPEDDFFSKLAQEENDSDTIARVLEEVEDEVRRAVSVHGPMKSHHEGYAVLLEEVDELWDEVKKRTNKRSPEKLREEAIQVAAMATRFVIDLL